MTSYVVSRLKEIALANNIIIIETHSTSCDPDVSVIEDRVIFMNLNFDTSISYAFRLAHELAHIIYGDFGSQSVYAFSIYSRKYEERQAHRHGLQIITDIIYSDTPTEYRNYIDFMHEFGLPAHFEELVKEVIYK